MRKVPNCWAMLLLTLSYSGLHVTAQFNTKVLFHAREKAPLWASDPIPSWSFGEDKTSFLSDQCQVRLSDESDSYSIKSSLNQSSKVDLKVVRLAPGFVAGKDGTSYFGPDQQNPWGSMRHAFWPRCKVEGTITTSSGVIDLTGLGSFVHALQGMKPHHAGEQLAQFSTWYHSC